MAAQVIVWVTLMEEPLQYLWFFFFFSAGCKNCANMCPDVFGIEEDFGRARVYNQCGKPELVQQAIDSWYAFAILTKNYASTLV